MALLEPRDAAFETFITLYARRPQAEPRYDCGMCSFAIDGRFHCYWDAAPGGTGNLVLLHAACVEQFVAAMGAPSKPPLRPAPPPADNSWYDPWGNPF